MFLFKIILLFLQLISLVETSFFRPWIWNQGPQRNSTIFTGEASGVTWHIVTVKPSNTSSVFQFFASYFMPLKYCLIIFYALQWGDLNNKHLNNQNIRIRNFHMSGIQKSGIWMLDWIQDENVTWPDRMVL